jgi:uncharacterized damage-inducible protein DinB
MDAILKAEPESWDMPQNSSFNSIRKTIYHIYDAEHTWLKRLQNLPYTWPPSNNFSGSMEEFGHVMLDNSTSLSAFAHSLGLNQFSNKIEYTNSKGQKFSNTIEDVLLHCCNHSSYHRGQIITLLRNASSLTHFEALDYIAFVRN